jgi:predicted acyltransferase
VPWEGFSFWDLIMPLFLFITGVSMPFSFAKRIEEGKGRSALYGKIFRRTIVLFLLGIAAQGNLFKWDLSKLHLYCNTLQAIAAGYFVAGLVMLNTSIGGQVAVAVALLAGFWVLMAFIPVPGHAAGVLEPNANLALYVDEVILRSFRDGTTYTWILSSMTFAATVILGVLAGHILRSQKRDSVKVLQLTGAGLVCLALGWVWGIWFPIIKHLWTSSMVLWSAGWCYLLLALFFAVIDVWRVRAWAFPLAVIGMNAIAVYMATRLFDFRKIGDIFVGELAPGLGAFGEFLRVLAAFLIVWLILYYMYRKRTFLRV